MQECLARELFSVWQPSTLSSHYVSFFSLGIHFWGLQLQFGTHTHSHTHTHTPHTHTQTHTHTHTHCSFAESVTGELKLKEVCCCRWKCKAMIFNSTSFRWRRSFAMRTCDTKHFQKEFRKKNSFKFEMIMRKEGKDVTRILIFKRE